MSTDKSYGQILRSTSITGSAAGIVFLLGMLSTKFAALVIGSTGVGLIAIFASIQGLIVNIAGLGIQSSAVREIAIAVSNGNEDAIGRSVIILRRACWLTGVVGMVVVMAFSPQLSKLTFNSDIYTPDIFVLGFVILLVNLAGGQLAILQGMRRIGDLARVRVAGAVLATFFAIFFYYWLKLRGILPAIVCTAFIQLLISWNVARKIPFKAVRLSWSETFLETTNLIKLGIVFMWSSVMVSAVSYFTIKFIAQEVGVHAVGLYSAAFLLSGMSVNFVLGAMGADYYPRLTSSINNKIQLNRLVNEQAEIALLLALPALMAILTFAPLLLQIFYSNEFIDATRMLQWYLLGCLGRIISWPMGFLILALGKGRWFLLSETLGNLIHLTLIPIGLYLFGLEGAAIAYSISSYIYIGIVFVVSYKLVGLSWSPGFLRIMAYGLPFFALYFIANVNFSGLSIMLFGILLTIYEAAFCLRELVNRIGSEHRLVKFILSLPLLGAIFISKSK